LSRDGIEKAKGKTVLRTDESPQTPFGEGDRIRARRRKHRLVTVAIAAVAVW